jgi:hypothetical protein
MFATLGKPYNYVGRTKGEAETLCLSHEEQESYIKNVLSENAHKKDLLDYSNPSKKLKTAMDLVMRGPKEKIIRELLRMHKFDFVVRTKLPPKHNNLSRSRDENVLRDARRTLNWLYEVADEEGINVTDINEPCSHFDHSISMFLSGDCVFDLRNTSLVRAAYVDCFDSCVYAIKEKRNKDRIDLENAILEDADEELQGFITPAPPKKKAKVPLVPFQLSPLGMLDESMMVEQDKYHYDPRFNKKASPTKKKRSPPQPQPTPSKWMSSEEKNGFSLLLDAATMTTPKGKPTPKDVTVLKRDSLVLLGGKQFKVTTEMTFEEVEELEVVDV